MTDYYEAVVRLVTEECTKGTSHKKVLEPLANMVASVLAGIDEQYGVDDRALFKSQLDKMFEKYREAYGVSKRSAN